MLQSGDIKAESSETAPPTSFVLSHEVKWTLLSEDEKLCDETMCLVFHLLWRLFKQSYEQPDLMS